MKGRIEIDLDGPGSGTIKVDGQELRGVCNLRVEAGVGAVTAVHLTLLAYDGVVVNADDAEIVASLLEYADESEAA